MWEEMLEIDQFQLARWKMSEQQLERLLKHHTYYLVAPETAAVLAVSCMAAEHIKNRGRNRPLVAVPDKRVMQQHTAKPP